MFTTLCWAVFVGVCGTVLQIGYTCYRDVLGLYGVFSGHLCPVCSRHKMTLEG